MRVALLRSLYFQFTKNYEILSNLALTGLEPEPYSKVLSKNIVVFGAKALNTVKSLCDYCYIFSTFDELAQQLG